MGNQVLEKSREAGQKRIEIELVLQCTPLISGLKASNLFMASPSDEKMTRMLLSHTDISFYRLLKSEKKAAFLLFRRNQLEIFLMQKEVLDILKEEGYQKYSLGNILFTFQRRYEAYMEGKIQFPHEMGLLLGYPAEDVKGFMEHKGKNFLCSGYWKVYHDMPEKVRLFHRFDAVRNHFLLLVCSGVCIEDMIDICSENIF